MDLNKDNETELADLQHQTVGVGHVLWKAMEF